MGFLDIFSGAGKARAEKAARGAQLGIFDQNLERLNQGVATARNDFTTGTNKAIDTLFGARDQSRQFLGEGQEDALGFIDQGVTGAQGALGQARGSFEDAGSSFDILSGFGSQLSPSLQLLLDSQGINGAEGNARATDAFGNSLRNTFELDQGLDAINRRRAAAGGGTVSGGNIDRDAQIFGQNLANSKTDAFVDRLFGLTDRAIGTEGTVASGRASAKNNIGNTFLGEGDILNSAGANRAQIAQDTANRIAAQTMGTGTQVAGLQEALGNRLGATALDAAGQEIGLRQLLGTQIGNSLRGQAAARSEGFNRSLDLGVQAANKALSLAGGGFPGLGSLGSLVNNGITGSLPSIGPVPRTRASALPGV